MDLNVYLQGDLEFANDTLVAVARMFNAGSTYDQIQTGAGVLIFLTLFLSYFKYILDPERSPYPFKEFVFGVMGFIMFVGPLSPRFTVHLQSVSTSSLDVRTVSNVPFLVAVPSWAGTNLIGGLRDLAANNFTTPSMGSNAPADPLGALVRLHSIPMSPVINSLDHPGQYDFKTSIKNYINDCYIPDQLLSTGNPNGNMGGLDAARLDKVIDKIKVTYPDYYTRIFLNNSPDGEYLSCDVAYNKIYAHINTGKFPTMVSSYYEARGVDAPSITAAYSLLTGGGMASPNPYEVMAGRFLAFHTYEALQGQDSPWVNKMVFESMQKRLYEQAGERSLFMNYMIPMISVFEMFTFFIGPVMILLSVMGGAGFAMIGKYMYLILFVNLWGFIKVFVDLFTYKAAEKAFSVSTSFAQMDPFSMGAMPAVISEVEGFLGVASALTAAIPMLAMFLLYGGVHSLMGVMSSVNPTGKGSVDGTNIAPRLSSSWSDGAQSMGTHSNTYNAGTGAVEANVKSSDSGRFANVNIDSGINNSLGNSISIAEKDVQSKTQAYEQTVSTAMASLEQNADVVAGSKNKTWSDMNTAEKTVALKRSLEEGQNISSDAASQAAFQIMGQAVISVAGGVNTYKDYSAIGGAPTPFKLGVNASVSSNLSNMDMTKFGIKDSSAQKLLEDVAESHKGQTTNSEQGAYNISESNQQSESFQESLNKGHKLQEQIAQSRELSTNLGEMYNSSNGLKFSQALNNEALAPLVDGKSLDTYIDGLSDDQVKSLVGNDAGGSVDSKKDYLKDKYQKEGAELAGPAQAGYGGMLSILDDILAKQPQSIDDVNSQADMLADWSQVVSDNAQSNGATPSQLNALSMMNDSYRKLDETTADGGVIKNASPELLGLDTDTSNAKQAENAIKTSKFDKPFKNDIPSESDYSKEKYGAMTEKQADAMKRVEGHTLLSGDQQDVIDRIKSGELNGAMWAFGQIEGEDKFARFAADRAAELGYDEKSVYEGTQALNTKSPSEIQDMFGRVNTGIASFDDMKSIAQMSHAADYLTNTQSGNNSFIVGLGAGELDEFSGSTLAFKAGEQALSNTSLGRDINSVMEMGGKNGFSYASTMDAVGLMAGKGGTVGAQFPYEANKVDLINNNQSYKNGVDKADKNTLFGTGVSYDKDESAPTAALNSFKENAAHIMSSNEEGYNSTSAAKAFTSLLDRNETVPGNPYINMNDVTIDKMLRGGDNNLLRSVYQNSDELRGALDSIPDEELPKNFKPYFNDILNQANEAYNRLGLSSLSPYSDGNEIQKTNNVDVPTEVSSSKSPVSTFKTDNGRFTLQSQNEDGSFVYKNEKDNGYSYKQGDAYMSPIESKEPSSVNPTSNTSAKPPEAPEGSSNTAQFDNSEIPLSMGVSAFAVGVPGLLNYVNSQTNTNQSKVSDEAAEKQIQGVDSSSSVPRNTSSNDGYTSQPKVDNDQNANANDVGKGKAPLNTGAAPLTAQANATQEVNGLTQPKANNAQNVKADAATSNAPLNTGATASTLQANATQQVNEPTQPKVDNANSLNSEQAQNEKTTDVGTSNAPLNTGAASTAQANATQQVSEPTQPKADSAQAGSESSLNGEQADNGQNVKADEINTGNTPLNTASTAQANATQQVTEPTQPKADNTQAGSESSLNADQADNGQNVKATDVGTGNAPLNTAATASTAQANATQQVTDAPKPKADNAQNVKATGVGTGNTPLNTAATASTSQANATQQVNEPTQPKADSAQAGSESSLNADQADNGQNVKATDVGTGNAPLNTAATASTAQANATQQVTEPTQPKADNTQAGSESSLNADQADNGQNVKATDVGTGNAPLNTAAT
ncbi:conjugal transfer protein TraG N-terminal domain-containing protein, partial [Pseudoalteromonas sp. SG44-1]|uniref:conjugal transfer protein TraG N-terminal domain-containing protein n=1 Tax=Pseudoalteromonas sp. SG44-1 TaxID=2760964 RepID=UPI00160351AE